jgi:hypothetical protein
VNGQLQPEWKPWSVYAPTHGPYHGVNGGQVVIRRLCGPAVIDRGQVVSRTTFSIVLRSTLTGRVAAYTLLRWRVEPLPPPASPRARRAHREGGADS